MRRKYTYIPMACLLTACGSGGATVFQASNPDALSFVKTDEDISIVLDGETITLNRDENLNTLPILASANIESDFIRASQEDADENKQIFLLQETDAMAVAMFIDQDKIAVVDPYLVRKIDYTPPQSGVATLTGSFVHTRQFTTGIPTFLNGDVTLNVSFNDMTIGGEILFPNILVQGLPPLSQNFGSFTLLPTTINGDGRFEGELDRDALAAFQPEAIDAEVAEFSGILGGTNTAEAAGLVRLGEMTSAGFVGEIGVFLAEE